MMRMGTVLLVIILCLLPIVFAFAYYEQVSTSVVEADIIYRDIIHEKVVEVPVEVIKYRDIVQEVPVEIEVAVEVPVEVEKVVYKHRDYRNFESLSEFTEWADGKIAVYIVTGKEIDCDDYAMRLQRLAADDGYLISCQIVYNGKVYNQIVSDSKTLHMGNLIVVSNNIYYVEPQPIDYRIVRLCYLD